MDIYVGNLPFTATEEEVAELFAAFGPVEKVKIVMDRETNRPRGFCFVTLADTSKAKEAADAVNGQELGGRPLRVNPAEPRESKPGGFGGGGGGGRGGFGGDRRPGGGGGGGKGGYGGGGGGGGKGGYGGKGGGGGGGGYGDRRGGKGGGGGYGGGKGGGGYGGGDDW
ncbi:RNA recognition motif domain-containing protein [Luteolibacter soli]|uniref:RNA-binding protein n=1 Tax=Luteolibacter soli TaxID=3135280 RepID=A0ABU9B0L0_9BACT